MDSVAEKLKKLTIWKGGGVQRKRNNTTNRLRYSDARSGEDLRSEMFCMFFLFLFFYFDK